MIEEYFAQDDWKISPSVDAECGGGAVDASLSFGGKEQPGLRCSTLGNAAAGLSGAEWELGGVRASCTMTMLRRGWGSRFLATPKTVVRSGYGIVFIDQSGITTPFTTPAVSVYFQKRAAEDAGQRECCGSACRVGHRLRPISIYSGCGIGAERFIRAKRAAGSGYVAAVECGGAAVDYEQYVGGRSLMWDRILCMWGIPGLEPQSVDGGAAWRRGLAADAR